MLPSYESRWFFRSCPPPLMEWFEYKGWRFGAPGNPARADFYLPIPSDKGLGFKLREGRLEAKQLLAGIGEHPFPPFKAKGKVEHWIKWSFELKEADELARQIIREKQYDWIEVKKERLGFTYHFQQEGKVAEVPIHTVIPEGCQVELTQIHVFGKAYYTFGLEAFSHAGHLEENFRHGAEVFFSTLAEWQNGKAIAELRLPAQASMGYPEFLSCLFYAL